MSTSIFPKIKDQIDHLDTDLIPETRRASLEVLADFIRANKDNDLIQLNFICTHNSRRSHLGQIWAQTLAHYHGWRNIRTYSGGTEATALFPKVAETLRNQGFQIESDDSSDNPVYEILYADDARAIEGFSKVYDDPANPKDKFAAVMTCSHADENCPFIPGTDKRISLPFEDPKLFDDSPQQDEKYMERSLQIATELHFVFNQLK